MWQLGSPRLGSRPRVGRSSRRPSCRPPGPRASAHLRHDSARPSSVRIDGEELWRWRVGGLLHGAQRGGRRPAARSQWWARRACGGAGCELEWLGARARVLDLGVVVAESLIRLVVAVGWSSETRRDEARRADAETAGATRVAVGLTAPTRPDSGGTTSSRRPPGRPQWTHTAVQRTALRITEGVGGG